MNINLNKKINSKTIFLSGSLIGFLVFLFVFTLAPLIPTNDFFCSVGFIENDIAQHYAGWMLFRQSDWQFPLGVSLNAAFPYGTSVSYTDSIPLFSIFFKILSPFIPNTFQFFGIFVALSYALMGGFSALLMNLFVDDYILNMLSALLFSFSPIMLERAFRHVALSAHFLIIACLYYYFKNKGNWTLKNSIPLIIINTITIGIHPYFLPFTFGISFAMFLEWTFIKKEFLKSSSFIFISLISTLLFGYIIGAFYSFDSAGDIGYGLYSLNLNSYFNPTSKGIENWSNIRNPLGIATPFQIESFNYLGFGVITALFIAFVFILIFKNIRKEVFNILKSSYGLIFVTIILTIFAITHTVTFHNFTIIDIPLPSKIASFASIFRASGRFGWLLHYLFYVVAIFCISKLKLKINSIPLIILSSIILIQVYDIYPAISLKNNYFKGEGNNNDGHTVSALATDDSWDTIFDDFNSIISIPNFSSINNGAIEFAIKAAKKDSDMKVNVAFEARAVNEKRDEFILDIYNDLSNGVIDKNTIYLVDSTAEFSLFITSGEYQAFNINGQIILISHTYSEEEIKEFEKSEYFTQITK